MLYKAYMHTQLLYTEQLVFFFRSTKIFEEYKEQVNITYACNVCHVKDKADGAEAPYTIKYTWMHHSNVMCECICIIR